MNAQILVARTAIALIMTASGAFAQPNSASLEFEGSIETPVNGVAQAIHARVQSWGIGGARGQQGPVQEIPLRGFYVAHLLGGEVLATIDGKTTKEMAGSYWAVPAGATMRVQVIGEYAVLETTTVVKTP